jgi:RecB family exonuclease
VRLSRIGAPLDARRRAVLVPTHAAAELLRQTLEGVAAREDRPGLILPDFLTRPEWLGVLHRVLSDERPMLSRVEREVLLGRAITEAQALHPPTAALFDPRPGLVSAMLDFYDELGRRLRGPRRFARTLFRELAVERGSDRGSESLIQQTRLLGFAFLAYERGLSASGGMDEHVLRRSLLAAQPVLPFDHLVIAVADHPSDPRGLWPADFDLVGRLTHLARVDVVVTDEAHDAGFRDRIEQQLPGIEEARAEDVPRSPILVRPVEDDAPPVFVCRDREEELREVVRTVHADAADHGHTLAEAVAIVFQRPLPYLYLAQQVLTDAGVPYQVFDALPLAGEPYASLLDLTLDVARAGTADSAAALSRSPLLSLPASDGHPQSDALVAELATFRTAPASSARIRAVSSFLRRHERKPHGPEVVSERHARARAAVLAVLDELANAFERHDDAPRDGDALTALIHHAIEARTFAPRRGQGGVHLVDAVSARFGDFDHVHLVGLVETEWPERVRRSMFYTPGLLKALGWPQAIDETRAHQAAFRDILQLAAKTTRLSAFQLEGEAIVGLSPMVEAIRSAGAVPVPARERQPIFADELLTRATVPIGLDPGKEAWLAIRRERPALSDRAYGGFVDRQQSQAYRVSRVDRYVDCPFKYFAESVLRLSEERDGTSGLTPLERGSLLHVLFERFYGQWQQAGHGAITAATMPDALAMFSAIADEALAVLPEADRALERTRLLGSIVATGVAERVFELEADSGVAIRQRRLESVLNGEFVFPRLHGLATRHIAIRGTADRIDVLTDGSIAVVDYKLGRMPDLASSVQIAVYAHCARQLLEKADGRAHRIASAMYLAFGDDRRLEGPIGSAQEPAQIAVEARVSDFAAAVERIEAGEFPPRPKRPNECQWCGFAGVCRKEYQTEAEDAAEPL